MGLIDLELDVGEVLLQPFIQILSIAKSGFEPRTLRIGVYVMKRIYRGGILIL